MGRWKERKRRKVQKRGGEWNAIIVGVVDSVERWRGCGVEVEQYKSSQPGGKRRRRGGEGGSASAEDAGEGMGTGVVSGRNWNGGAVAPGSPALLLSRSPLFLSGAPPALPLPVPLAEAGKCHRVPF